ncbi:hypothetical protein BWK59_02540 [Flavobacterium davisii]|uniref:Uncharacterized protein n=1 Tax=Flavobacterium davisii TaxID=2906077 RepID=A0A246GKX2_9FLAO|nr:hypothetical protein [Flavobacterium davisii]OWP85000.1 hypothetical protein BWK59_02540 [Flavobacterium davisii]
MKKISLILILSVMLFAKASAQNLKNDCEFYKTTTYLLSSLQTVDSVLKSDNKSTDLTKEIPSLKANNSRIQKSYNILKLKYAKDKDFVEFENWCLFSNKIEAMLNKNDQTLEFGLYLVKDGIVYFLNTKY